jgi:protein kinase-like protein
VLASYIDSGGNGEVWQTTGDGARTVIKILKDNSRERVQRFRDEVEIHRRLGRRPGVLPVVESAVPDTPTRSQPAWLTMPAATPIERALGENPSLNAVVTAIRRIAQTMTELHAEGISHRDIKPGNLFEFESDWALGDFGLVSFPEKTAITASGRKLGPANFLAPEMLQNPDTAIGPPADVFSLAKTLWALAAGFRFPLPGHLSASEPEASLSKWMTGFNTRPLDLLIDRATRLGPKDRCTMRDVSVELSAWLEPPAKGTMPNDLSHLAPTARVLIQPHQSKEALVSAGVAEGVRLLAAIKKSLGDLDAALSTTGLETRRGDGWGWWRDFVDSTLKLQWIDDGRCQGMANVITGKLPVYMASGVTFRLTLDGQVELGGGHSVYWDGTPGEHIVIHRVEPRVVSAGSAIEPHSLNEIANDLVQSAGAAAETLLRLIERWNSGQRKSGM